MSQKEIFKPIVYWWGLSCKWEKRLIVLMAFLIVCCQLFAIYMLVWVIK